MGNSGMSVRVLGGYPAFTYKVSVSIMMRAMKWLTVLE